VSEFCDSIEIRTRRTGMFSTWGLTRTILPAVPARHHGAVASRFSRRRRAVYPGRCFRHHDLPDDKGQGPSTTKGGAGRLYVPRRRLVTRGPGEEDSRPGTRTT